MSLTFTNTTQFNKDLVKFVELTETRMEQVVRKVSIDIFNGVTERTPVDLGNARASWNLNRSSPDLSVEDTLSGGTSAATAVNSAQKSSFQAKGSPVIYITNNLPYIGALERGHSKQSGKGFMIQRTINEIADTIKDAVRRLG